MTVGGVLMMGCLDFCFQGEIFERLFAFPIDVLAIDTQRRRNSCFIAGLADYLDFF